LLCVAITMGQAHCCASRDEEKLRETNRFTERLRPPCMHGVLCPLRVDFKHIAEQAHPFDVDYARACDANGMQAVEPTLRGLFYWVDVDASGKLSREELEAALPLLKRLRNHDFRLTEEAWQQLDVDGNGVVNFSEFAEWAGPRLGLPLGVTGLFPVCGIVNCPCSGYRARKPRKRDRFMISSPRAVIENCECGHKKWAHTDTIEALWAVDEVPIPDYWEHRLGEFDAIVPIEDASELKVCQNLLNTTYSDVWTRDRKKHNPEQPKVPRSFRVSNVLRCEHRKFWRGYAVRRGQMMAKYKGTEGCEKYDVKSSCDWSKERLAPQINEWYLFHGTSPSAARSIARNGFKISLSGSNTGMLYGCGVYMAESITKADEYSKVDDSGVCDDERAVLVCRALGGSVRYTDEVEPDAEKLVQDCISGPYDSILGDREKCRKTYREFVFYDTEDVYVEYIIHYKRVFHGGWF